MSAIAPISDCSRIRRLRADQREARRVGVARGRAPGSSLPLLKRPFGIDALLVVGEGLRAPRASRNSSLVMPMPCSPEITPSSDARELHDARDRLVRLLQHLVVVGVDRDVGVHVAVARVHVQRDEDAAAQHLACGSPRSPSATGSKARPSKMSRSGAQQLALPRDADRVVLQQVEERRRRRSLPIACAMPAYAEAPRGRCAARASGAVEVVEQPAASARARLADERRARARRGRRAARAPGADRPSRRASGSSPAKQRLERVDELQLVARSRARC